MLKRKKFKRFLGSLLFGCGVYLIILGSLLRYQDQVMGFFHPPVIQKNINPLSLPRKIIIPSLSLEAQIKTGGIADGVWLTDEQAVMFLDGTGRPGEGYNTVLYSHNRPGLFADLKKLKEKDLIKVVDSTGRTFTYEVYFMTRAKPKEVAILQSDLPNTLTLFTCDGWFDALRLIVKAKMVG